MASAEPSRGSDVAERRRVGKSASEVLVEPHADPLHIQASPRGVASDLLQDLESSPLPRAEVVLCEELLGLKRRWHRFIDC